VCGSTAGEALGGGRLTRGHVPANQEVIARSEESRYDHRLHGVLLVSQGLSGARVAEWFGEDLRMAARWVQRFHAWGFASLRKGERPAGHLASAPASWRDALPG